MIRNTCRGRRNRQTLPRLLRPVVTGDTLSSKEASPPRLRTPLAADQHPPSSAAAPRRVAPPYGAAVLAE